MTDAQDGGEDGYIVEFVSIGKSVKVTAIDPVSLREATIIGDVKAPRKQLTELAVRKLQYVMNKDRDEQ